MEMENFGEPGLSLFIFLPLSFEIERGRAKRAGAISNRYLRYRIGGTRASFNFRANEQSATRWRLKGRENGYKFRGANKFRAPTLRGNIDYKRRTEWTRRNEFRAIFRPAPKTPSPSPVCTRLTNFQRIFFHYVSIYFVYDSSTICSASSCNEREEKKKKKKDENGTKNINTSSLSSYCLIIARVITNLTRFRYMKK